MGIGSCRLPEGRIGSRQSVRRPPQFIPFLSQRHFQSTLVPICPLPSSWGKNLSPRSVPLTQEWPSCMSGPEGGQTLRRATAGVQGVQALLLTPLPAPSPANRSQSGEKFKGPIGKSKWSLGLYTSQRLWCLSAEAPGLSFPRVAWASCAVGRSP